ncbi:hypothetical protein M405DRAFT_644019 [Rhizopogon salebrosus TDB-379]|nr:hypothetical protein M405DRAFT_644019 [Rhizopogon salebrosus TDB-379]
MSKSKQSAPQKAAKSVVVKAHKKKPAVVPRLDAGDSDSDKENAADAGGISDAKKTRVMIYWSKPENHHLTDQLLSLIEDSPLWMSVFGFDKGTSGSAVATGKGKNNLQIHVQITSKSRPNRLRNPTLNSPNDTCCI